MKIFYIENQKDLSLSIPLLLEAELVCTVFEADSEMKAIRWLKTNDVSDLSLIIFNDYNSQHEGELLYQYIKNHCSHVPVLLVANTQDLGSLDGYKTFLTDHPYNAINARSEGAAAIVDHVVKISSLIQSIPKVKPTSSFCRVSYSRFRILESAFTDVYIRISGEKFVKILKRGDSLTDGLVDHYLSKGVDGLYIHRDDFVHFSELFHRFLEKKIQENPNSTGGAEVHLRIFEGVQDHILNLGLDSATVEHITHISEETINTVRKDPGLGAMIATIMKNENYLSEHSLMISYISSAIAMEMDWVSDSTLEKLSAASILHDACLLDCDLAKESQLHEQDWKAHLPRKEAELVKMHPYKMFELTRKSSYIEPCVDLIILNHHELEHGEGYPRHLDWRTIYPLACLFIVAEDFVHGVYGQELKTFNIKKMLEEMKLRHTKGMFKKAVLALESIFIQKKGFLLKK